MSTRIGARTASIKTNVSIYSDERSINRADQSIKDEFPILKDELAAVKDKLAVLEARGLVDPLQSNLTEHLVRIGNHFIELQRSITEIGFSHEKLEHQLVGLNSNIKNGFGDMAKATSGCADTESASHQEIGNLGGYIQELGGLVEQLKHHAINPPSPISHMEGSSDTKGLHEQAVMELSDQLLESDSRLAAVNAKLEAKQEEIDRLESELARAVPQGDSKDAVYWKAAAEEFEESLSLQRQQMQELDAKHTKTRRLLLTKLHIAAQELAAAKGAIRVICRIKPEPPSEEDAISFTNPDSDDQSFLPWTKLRATYLNDSKKTENRDYQFQRVFGSGETNHAIFDEVKDVAKSAAFGQACTIMAYGATGTGKSYTFLSADGLVQRYFRLLFALAEEEEGLYDYEFYLSAVEIYMNKIYDLLEEPTRGQKAEVRLSCEYLIKLNSEAEAVDILQKTINQREAASTKQNATSSRSHFIISITISRKARGESGEKPTQGFIKFIDLAGSEAAAKNFIASGSDPRNKLIYEQGQDINKGLLDLGQGVRNLATKGKFFPGHNLTRALRLSLVPGSRMLVVVTVSPLTVNQTNSLNTLRWSQEAVGVSGDAPGPKTITTRAKAPEAATPPRGKLPVPSSASGRPSYLSPSARSTPSSLGSRRW